MPRRVALRHNLYLRAASPFNSLETTNHVFHTAILRKHGPAFTGVDAGLLAETLLFYSNVHIVAHRGVLVDLLKTIGPEALIRLIEEKKISLTFLRTDFGTATNTHNGLKFHAFIAYQLGGSQGKKKASREEDVVSCFEFALGESWQTRRLAKRFLKGIVIQQNIDVPGHPKGIPGLALADLDDPQYVQDAIKDFIVSLVPSYQLPMNFHFSIMRGTGDDFLIDHNIDLGTLNQKFARSYPSMNAALTPELLVDQLLEAQAELQLASRYLAEIRYKRSNGCCDKTKTCCNCAAEGHKPIANRNVPGNTVEQCTRGPRSHKFR